MVSAAATADRAAPARARALALAAYFALAFGVAWTLWFSAAILAPPGLGPAGRQFVFLPGTFAPGLVALSLTWRYEGKAGVRRLLERVAAWEVAARFYVLAIAYMTGVKLAAAVAHRIVTGSWPAFHAEAWPLMILAAAFSTPFQAGEEVGWRGYALPRLAAYVPLGAASVVLGVIWACWHLPLFVIPGTTTTGQPFAVYLVSVTAISVAMAWMYWRTGGSLLLVMLMHAAINNTKDIVPSAVSHATPAAIGGASVMSWLTAAVLWGVALVLLARMPRSRRSREWAGSAGIDTR